MIYTKKDMVTIIHNAAKTYETELCHKNLLIIFGAPNKPNYVQTIANEKNFQHLTGTISNLKDDNASKLFYTKALDGNLSPDDFEINLDGTTQLKMEILNQTLRLSKNAKMIGDFNNGRIRLKTDKIAGGTGSCMGFVIDDGFYVPNTVLNGDMRTVVTNPQRILAILSKNVNETQYVKATYIAKKIEIKPLLTKLSKDVPIDKSLYQDDASLEERIADKISVISTEAVCNNPTSLIELYELTKQGSVRNTNIERISIEHKHVFQSFDAYLHNTIEIERAYDSLGDITEKPDFEELHERLDTFLSPFIFKERESLIWSPESATWEREKESTIRANSESQLDVKSNTTYKNKTDTIDAKNDTNSTAKTKTESVSNSAKNTKWASKLAKLNATINDSTFALRNKSTPADDLTHHFN